MTTYQPRPPFDLFVWKSPRDVDATAAAALVKGWQDAGGDPAASPFESTTDMGWFYRELKELLPELDAVSDAIPRTSRTPIWMSGTNEAPARVVAIRQAGDPCAGLDEVFSLAMKYDLVVYDANRRDVHLPLERMSAYASATFWPRGAIRSVVAAAIGAAIAIGAWIIGIPILSGIAVIVGVFLFVLCVWVLIAEGRKRLAAPPPTPGDTG